MSARQQQRKLRFLKAFGRIGTITGAARASRISRDAAHDWLRNDPSFARQHIQIKRHRDDEDFDQLQSALVFFQHVARSIVPTDVWPRLTAELALAVVRLKSDLKGSAGRMGAPSEIPVEAPLSHNRFGEVAVLERGNGAFIADFAR